MNKREIEPPCDDRCMPRGDRAGIVGYPGFPQVYDTKGPIASTAVCSDPAHIQQAEAWAYAQTGHLGIFQSNEELDRLREEAS